MKRYQPATFLVLLFALYVLFQIRGYLPLLRTRAKIARW